MASNQGKRHGRLSKKVAIWITLVMVVLLCSGFVLASQIKTVYQVAYKGTSIGVASNPKIVSQWFQTEYASFASSYPDIQLETNESDFSFLEMKKFNARPEDDAVIDSLQKRYVVEGRGVQVIVNGQAIGIVKDRETAEQILAGLQQAVKTAENDFKVQTLSYNNDDSKNKSSSSTQPKLKSIGFVEKVRLEPILSAPSDFVSEADLTKRLRGTDKQPKLSVKTEAEYIKTVSISGGVEVTYDKTMRVGTTKVTNPGKAGKKQITYLITKVNGKLVDEQVLKEEMLNKAVPKKVTRGSKVIEGVGTGAFEWPITGPTITSKFGKRWGRLHAGTDTVSANRDIYASDSGKVITAEYNRSLGNHVIIDHRNGYKTVYAHLSKIKVKKGALLEKGDLLGIMGTTGQSTGVHLHFEVRKGSTQLNPLTFLE
jgi:murein DD-endopeptidase MepM/ murein hydrolase activator NlpD